MTNEEAMQILSNMIHDDIAVYGHKDKPRNIALDMAIEALKDQRPHGEWEFIGENLFMCTNCGYSADADYLRKWKACKYDSIFPTACPNCGADMRKEGEAE